MLTLNTLTKAKAASAKPDHHIIPAPHSQAESGWISYLASWTPSPARTRPALRKTDGIAGFRNPWPSWHKATLNELRESCQWGEPKDGCLELADSHLTGKPVSPKPEASRAPRFNDINDWPNSPGAKAARMLRVEDPDFSFSGAGRAKVTWLGHAGYLVQLPSLDAKNSRPVRCLFDPMFSSRASPSQLAGPIRSYPPPCKAEDLPQIDALFLSHNHYDHMDYDSIMAVWKRSSDVIRFFVPLGNKKWLVDWGITGDRVVEMDWWDTVQLSHPTSTSTHGIKITCTPAQHNSWRSGTDADSALWSSWYLEHQTPNKKPYRVFFAGDTGYQFHSSPSWPPSPNNPSPAAAAAAPTPTTTTPATSLKPSSTTSSLTSAPTPSSAENEPFPPCPAFTEIRARLGSPHLLLLPISVGATYDYVRSFVPLPDWVNPVPRLSQGVTAANHMPSWDAVRVLKVLTGRGDQDQDGDVGGDEGQVAEGDGDGEPAPVAFAMHWGTFVTDPIEVPQTLGELEWACKAQGVRFGRALPGRGVDNNSGTRAGDGGGGGGGESAGGAGETAPWFLALNHGQSVYV